MNRLALTISAGALFAIGCGTSSQTNAQATAPTATQASPAMASYDSSEDESHASSNSEGHHAKHAAKARAEAKSKKMSAPMGEAAALLEQGKYDAAAERFATLTAEQPDNPKAFLMHGYALHAAGRLDEALLAHERAAQFEAVAPTALYNMACAHALQGNTNEAFAALDRAADAGFAGAKHASKDSDLASLRDDPRFAAFMERAGTNLASKKRMKKGEWKDHEVHGDQH